MKTIIGIVAVATVCAGLSAIQSEALEKQDATSLKELNTKLAMLRLNYTEGHPEILRVKKQIAARRG